MDNGNSQVDSEAMVERYRRRQAPEISDRYGSKYWGFIHHARSEREYFLGQVLFKKFSKFSDLKVLEVGAGGGDNFHFFRRLGVPEVNLTAMELIPERVELLKANFPSAKILVGDANTLDPNEKFDIVLQSTVFTSILDSNSKRQLAERMRAWTKPGGVILWYDFVYNNPRNADVKGVPASEVRSYFGMEKNLAWKKVTLAPPIGRRVGRLYSYFNFKIFRTHLLAVWEKV